MSFLRLIVATYLLCRADAVFSDVSQSSYNLSPSMRTIYPQTVHSTNGTVSNQGPVFGSSLAENTYVLLPNSSITYDFGQITAGFLSVQFGSSNGSTLRLSFAENAMFIGPDSDESVLYGRNDGYIPMVARPNSTVRVDAVHGRGAFRYVTLTATTMTEIRGIFNEYSALPGTPDSSLRKYTGHFLSSDNLLNKIWYAGAYTTQLCLIAANSSVDHITYIINGQGWGNNATVIPLQSHDVFLADGAKRDRNPWAGDLSVAVASVAVSHSSDNLTSIKNALRGMFVLQNNDTGYFPYPGSPLGTLLNPVSDTYHMWTIAGFADYVLRTRDAKFASKHMPAILKGVEAVRRQIEPSTGLFNGSGSNDWGRIGLTGETTVANAILYHTLKSLVGLATVNGHVLLNATYVANLEQTSGAIKAAMNVHLYDSTVGMYYDNTTLAGRQLFPQDGNSYAIRYNLTTSPAQARRVSAGLAARLGRHGAPAPELPTAISPFVGSHEVEAHFRANPTDASAALNLIRRQWGYMRSFSDSTHVEGYATDGSLEYAFYPTASFISHAHAWSTGPTSSLIYHVLGISDVAVDAAWVFAPAYLGSNLTHCAGGFTSGDVSYGARWSLSSDGTLTAQLDITGDATGIVRLPARAGRDATVTIDGTTRPASLTPEGLLEVADVPPGRVTIVH